MGLGVFATSHFPAAQALEFGVVGLVNLITTTP